MLFVPLYPLNAQLYSRHHFAPFSILLIPIPNEIDCWATTAIFAPLIPQREKYSSSSLWRNGPMSNFGLLQIALPHWTSIASLFQFLTFSFFFLEISSTASFHLVLGLLTSLFHALPCIISSSTVHTFSMSSLLWPFKHNN